MATRRSFLFGTASAASLLLARRSAFAGDWPQWRGPGRNGVSDEIGWLTQWPMGGPRRVWAVRIGVGFSGVAVVGNRAYTMGNSADQDVVYCLDAESGRTVWSLRYPCPAGEYEGPRATPTVLGGRVYTLSREGHALCLDAATGQLIWRQDLRRVAQSSPPRWGFAGSPLVDGNLVLYNVGSGGAALDRQSGRLVWRSAPGTAGYASPVLYQIPGQRGVALFTAEGLVAADPASGRRLWFHPWRTSYDVNAADPIFIDDTVFLSSDYGRGCALLRISGNRPVVLWENREMRNHFNSCVYLNGYLYGNDENTLKCLDARTGAARWQYRSIDRGGLIAAANHLIVLTGRGDLLLARAQPDRFTEVARARVLTGECWTAPTLAHGRLYCRNHDGDLVCLDLRAR